MSMTISNELETILNQLSMTDKTIILAKEYYGYNYQEMSELLDLPVSTLKSKVFRLRKKMIKERSQNE